MFIKDVFEQFLSEQESKLAPKTYRDYASVIELFEHQLDGYAWNNLADGDKAYDSPPYTFFLLNGDMELYRNRHLFI